MVSPGTALTEWAPDRLSAVRADRIAPPSPHDRNLPVVPLRTDDTVKALIRLAPDAAQPAGLSYEQAILFRLYETMDGQEGIDAFLEKREPQFKGE